MAININGVTYYKLDTVEHGYPGDITKNCSLRGEEIDGNFNFLRGHDLETVSFDENGALHITRYNGEILTAEQPKHEVVEKVSDFDVETITFAQDGTLQLIRYNGEVLSATPVEKEEDSNISYNENTGLVSFITPDGKEVILNQHTEGVLYHDYTLKGDGTEYNPLTVNNQFKTGHYLPAIKLIDTTLIDQDGRQIENLPSMNVAKFDRYVTKERHSRFGRLYPLTGVENIAQRLNDINSEWHVPSKEEWDLLLNTVDCDKPNHDSIETNVELGESAGSILKSVNFWLRDSDDSLLSEDTYGFSILPVGYCGNRGTRYYGSFGEAAAYWTATLEGTNRDMYVKTFEHDSTAVGQYSWGESYYLSLRLVKKANGYNFNEIEVIDGVTYACVQIPGTSLIWTRDNVCFTDESYLGFEPTEWNNYENGAYNVSEMRYFINEWDGNNWLKQEIKEGESIVLYEGDSGNMHNWRVIKGQFIDIDYLVQQSQNDEIKKEREARIASDTELHNAIKTEENNRIESDKTLAESIEAERKIRAEIDDIEKTNRIEADAELRNLIKNETDERITAITQEAINRTTVDNELRSLINTETNERIAADELEKSERITADELEKTARVNADELEKTARVNADELEKSERIAAIQDITNSITTEVATRQEQDNLLQSNIENEASERQMAIAQLNNAINAEIDNRNNSDQELQKTLSDVEDRLAEEIKNRNDADTSLQNEIKDLSNSVNDAVQTKLDSLEEIIQKLQQELTNTRNELIAVQNALIVLQTTAITEINGTDYEIGVVRDGNSVTIKFDDDARFIAG